MFDLPIPQPEESEQPKPVETFTQSRAPERFRAEALEYERGNVKALLKKMDWMTFLGAIAGTAIGYLGNFGNSLFTASLLASAVFLYASRR